MQNEMINQLITKFNDVVDSLIKDFNEFNLDEDTLVDIAKKTRNFIIFNELTLSNIMFAVLEKINVAKYNFDYEITQVKEMIRQLFERLNKDIDHILEHDDEEEHAHGHDHSHTHHHVHVDIDEVQDDIQEIIKCLEFLKKVFADLFDIVLASLKYQVGTLEDEEYTIEYNKFKENVKKLEEEFAKIFE